MNHKNGKCFHRPNRKVSEDTPLKCERQGCDEFQNIVCTRKYPNSHLPTLGLCNSKYWSSEVEHKLEGTHSKTSLRGYKAQTHPLRTTGSSETEIANSSCTELQYRTFLGNRSHGGKTTCPQKSLDLINSTFNHVENQGHGNISSWGRQQLKESRR